MGCRLLLPACLALPYQPHYLGDPALWSSLSGAPLSTPVTPTCPMDHFE